MITIALAKGYLLQDSLGILKKAGAWVPDDFGRKLSVTAPDQSYKYFLIRPTDVPVYVEHGAADLGIVGKDILEEGDEKVVELLDLKTGYCRLVVAAPQTLNLKVDQLPDNLRVATKFTNCALQYFNQKGLKAELIKLYGSVELAPLTGLSDVIVDLVATGKTLKDNGLVVVDTILKSSSRLIANSIRYRLQYEPLTRLIKKIEKIVH